MYDFGYEDDALTFSYGQAFCLMAKSEFTMVTKSDLSLEIVSDF